MKLSSIKQRTKSVTHAVTHASLASLASSAALAAKAASGAAKNAARDTKDFAAASRLVAKQVPLAVRGAYALRKATRLFR